jgi:IS5 family transposase
MLPEEHSLPNSRYLELYDLIVPKDNLLRKFNLLIDFSFVYEELSCKYCPDNGRMAESPIRMFKYLLLKTIYDISDVDVVERSMYDMSFKYFLGMTPEAGVIDPSSLCKFRKLRLKDTDLLNLLIGKTVSIAMDKGIIKSKTLIVDATHSKSRSNPHSPIEILRLRAKQLRKALYETDESIRKELPDKNNDDDLSHEIDYTNMLMDTLQEKEELIRIPKIKERLNMLREVVQDIRDHYTTSKDEDARLGHKSKDSSFFGYKTHIGMSDEGIITAAVVTSGEKGDGPQLKEVVEQSRNNGMDVDTVLGDSAYSGDANLKMAAEEENGFRLVSKVHPLLQRGNRVNDDGFELNKDAGMYVCPAGHMATSRRNIKYKPGKGNPRVVFGFDVKKCKFCSRREGCYKDGAKSKTYSISVCSDEQQKQMAFQDTEEFKKLSRERYKIEAKNAELKNVFGYDRALSYGLSCMQMQGAMVIFAANLKRILKLM